MCCCVFNTQIFEKFEEILQAVLNAAALLFATVAV